MTVDQLEALLRQKGIAHFQDIQSVSIGPNGQIGYELMPHAKPVTLGDLERLLDYPSFVQLRVIIGF